MRVTRGPPSGTKTNVFGSATGDDDLGGVCVDDGEDGGSTRRVNLSRLGGGGGIITTDGGGITFGSGSGGECVTAVCAPPSGAKNNERGSTTGGDGVPAGSGDGGGDC